MRPDEPHTWTTDEAKPGCELSYWNEAICDAIFELRTEADNGAPFTASLHQQRLGSIGLSRIHVGASQRLLRTRRQIAGSRIEQFELVYFICCDALLRHAGREVELGANQCVLIDSRKEYELTMRGRSENFSIHIPVKWLEVRLPYPERALAQPILGSSPWGAALVASLRAIASGDDGHNCVDDLYAEQVAGALSLAVGRPDGKATQYAHRLYIRVRQCLQDLFQDHNLTAATLAAKSGISLRYLHSLFAAEGTTYGAELLSTRLEAAARMLRDRRFREVSVSEIGHRAGFLEPSHFSRRFRDRYDKTPAVYRLTSTD